MRLRFPGDDGRVSRMSLIDENNGRHVRMANLACAGSHAINGVAELHTELLKRQVLPDWVDMYPERFVNITNGVTPRRFLVLSNPGLTRLISDRIGDTWPTHLDALRGLEAFVRDPDFRQRWHDVKRDNKVRLAQSIKDRTGITVDPDSLFDIQVKRIHEYKRQHLNVLHIITLYRRLKANPDLDMVPRTFIFGGKAAPGYQAAKLIIKLVNAAGELINSDPDVRDRLKVVFFPDFDVKKGQWIYPAADISEQISTAGLEASGTGNMKFAMNGCLDDRNARWCQYRDRREEVGPENFFLFGLTAEEVNDTKQKGYVPRALYEQKRRAARRHRDDRFGGAVAWRPEPVPAAARRPALARPVHAARRLPVLCGLPGRRQFPVAQPGGMDPEVDPQRGAHRQVLLRPFHPRLLRQDLAREAAQRKVERGLVTIVGSSLRAEGEAIQSLLRGSWIASSLRSSQ